MPEHNKTTHFGYQTVHTDDKQGLVDHVFDSVAQRYDVMNDLMSAGLHRWWKRCALEWCAVQSGQHVLDLAGGTGDLAASLSRQVGADGQVVVADINAAMLEVGRDKLINRGVVGNIDYVQANAECLPFAEASFDVVTMAFGLRNVTDKEAALRAIAKVLKPGGCCVILEFSKPQFSWLNKAYDWYSFNILPTMGRWVADDEESYRYLAESIRRHPDQETLKTMMEEAGFDRCEYDNMTGGIVAAHKGIKDNWPASATSTTTVTGE